MDIVIKKLNETHVEGFYFGQPYKINLSTGEDEYAALTDSEVKRVLDNYYSLLDKNKLMQLKKGSIVQVRAKSSKSIILYELEVDEIIEFNDYEGNYVRIAFGHGITEEDKEYSEIYSHVVDKGNLVKTIEPTVSLFRCNTELTKVAEWCIAKTKKEAYFFMYKFWDEGIVMEEYLKEYLDNNSGKTFDNFVEYFFIKEDDDANFTHPYADKNDGPITKKVSEWVNEVKTIPYYLCHEKW